MRGRGRPRVVRRAAIGALAELDRVSAEGKIAAVRTALEGSDVGAIQHAVDELNASLQKIGEEARVDLAGFTLEGRGRKGLRNIVNRFDKDGFAFEIVDASGVRPLLAELREVSDEWQGGKETREKGFSLGFFDERYLALQPVGDRAGDRVGPLGRRDLDHAVVGPALVAGAGEHAARDSALEKVIGVEGTGIACGNLLVELAAAGWRRSRIRERVERAARGDDQGDDGGAVVRELAGCVEVDGRAAEASHHVPQRLALTVAQLVDAQGLPGQAADNDRRGAAAR